MVEHQDDRGPRQLPADAPEHLSPHGAAPTPRTRRLCEALLEVAGLDGAAVAMITATGERDLVDATDPLAAHLDELQFTLAEGPCLEAHDDDRPVSCDDLASDAATTRWPAFAPEAAAAGARAVYAWPLAAGEVTFGVLELYRRAPGSLADTAWAHVDTAVAALSQVALDELFGEDTPAEPHSWPGRLTAPHAQVHQAAGMVSVHLDVPVPDAMARLRATAYSEHLTLVELARRVLEGHTRLEKDT